MSSMDLCLPGDHTDTMLGGGTAEMGARQCTRCLAICLMPSPHIAVPPPLDSISLQRGMTRRACSGLSRKWTKKSPSLCQLSRSNIIST